MNIRRALVVVIYYVYKLVGFVRLCNMFIGKYLYKTSFFFLVNYFPFQIQEMRQQSISCFMFVPLCCTESSYRFVPAFLTMLLPLSHPLLSLKCFFVIISLQNTLRHAIQHFTRPILRTVSSKEENTVFSFLGPKKKVDFVKNYRLHL